MPKNFTDFGSTDTERCTVNEVKKYDYEQGLFVPSLAGIAKLIDHDEKGIRTLIDSGAETNVIDWRTVQQYNLPTRPIQKSWTLRGVTGATDEVVSKIASLRLRIWGKELRVRCYVTNLGNWERIILGMPWMAEHNPIINWRSRTLIGWDLQPGDMDKKHPEALRKEFPSVNKTTISTELEAKIVKETVSLPEQYRRYEIVFSETDIPLPEHRGRLDHEIKLTEEFKPKKGSIYPLSSQEREELDTFLNENLACGKIQPSVSPQSAPVFFVAKKDGKKRLIQDYRYLNSHTVVNSYPLPDIKMLLDDLASSSYFAKFDVRWGFTNIQIKAGDEWKAAFITPRGVFEPLVMFFGQTNAPPTFQRYMNEMFSRMIGEQKVVIFMDDVIVHGKTCEELTARVSEFLQQCKDEDLRLKISKSTFETQEVDFLGYKVKCGQYSPCPVKTAAIKDWPTPTNLKELCSFIGFCNFYRMFIANFSQIAHSLHLLTKKDQEYVWGEEQQQAFQELKTRLTSSLVLRLPDLSKPFIVQTDASKLGTGAVLLQQDTAGVPHPCAYLSQALVGAEQNYQVYDLELLAVIRTLKAWQPYLVSPVEPTMIYTDHQNITYFRQPQDLTARQMRWHSILQEYPVWFVHIAGKKNGAPDLLSRMAHFVPSVTPQLTLIPNSLVDCERGGVKNLKPGSFSVTKIEAKTPTSSTADGQRPTEEKPKTAILSGKGVLTLSNELAAKARDYCLQRKEKKEFEEEKIAKNKKRIYIPAELRREALREYHDARPAGHPGVGAMMKKVLRHLWWPTIHRDVRQYVRGCQTCQAAKVNTHPTAPPITPHDVTTNPFPFKQVSVDLVTNLPPAKGFDSILTIVDQGLTKGAYFLPTNKMAMSADIATLYHNTVYPNFGIPDAIISDRGPQFVSSFTRDLYSKSGIEMKATTAYRPQSNGEAERVNQEIGTYLRMYCAEKPDDWSLYLADAQFAHNSRIHSTHGQTPFYLLHGYEPTAYPSDIANPPGLADDRLEQLAANRDKAIIAHKRAQEAMIAWKPGLAYEKFEVGDKVWLDARNLHLKSTRKLTPRRLGPFEIIEEISPVVYKLRLPSAWRIHDVFHALLLTPQVVTSEYGVPATPPLPELVDGEPEFEVENILRHKHIGRKKELRYLVQWHGYSRAESTWEPEEHLKNAPEVLEAYKSTHCL